MTTILVLCGLPGTGKSTYVQSYLKQFPETVVCSTDDYIEQYAKDRNSTYDDVFFEAIKMATEHMWKKFAEAIANDQRIIMDQTNLTMKKRRQILSKVPHHYMKISVYFDPPDKKKWAENLANRPGKTIPRHIMDSMIQNVQKPHLSEGFNAVLTPN